MRGIFERLPGSGVWWISYFDSARRRRREKAGSKSAALALYRKRKTEALEGKKLPEKLRAAPVFFREIAEDALAYSREHKRSYRTDEIRMKRLKDWFGERPAESLASSELETWLKGEVRDEGWSPSTYNRYRSLLSLVYREAIRNSKASQNPVRGVRHLHEDTRRLRYLTREQYCDLRRVVAKDWPQKQPELDFAIYTGLRFSSQYRLTWDMVDWSARMLHIPRTKNGEALHFPLADEALAALRLARMQSDGTGYVFRSSLHPDSPVKDNRGWFKKALRLAGIADLRWHDLRHTFASWLRQEGVPLETIAELLGHKGLQMSLRYAHLGAAHLHEAVDRLKRSGTISGTGAREAPKEQPAYVQ
jgi:integrase